MPVILLDEAMRSTQAIGGYFELELRERNSLFHNRATAVNSGRNAFAYILESLAAKKVYLPSYVCPVLLQPLQTLKINYTFYPINEKLEPQKNIKVGRDEYILYVNYFGLKNAAVRKFAQKYANTIIDNAQAFFNLPCSRAATFYSPRKFFGVPDGGFAYTRGNSKPILLKNDTSFKRCVHLLKRIELGSSEGFSDFRFHEKEFDNRSMAEMSRLTKKILLSIDYEWVCQKRNSNFNELHKALHKFNRLSHMIDGSAISGPMMYPYLGDIKSLRKHLQENNIFTPIFWPHLSEMGNGSNDFDSYLADHLIPLPIDQRYDRQDMRRIVSVIKKYNG